MSDPPVVWISEQVEAGEVAFRIGRRGDRLVADLIGLGTLSATRSGDVATFDPAPGATVEAIRKAEQGIVPALLRHLRQKLTLHGSAVAWGGRALACIGESGAGKSTTAAALCLRHGGELVADDTTAIEFGDRGIELVPTERVHWLVGGGIEPRAGLDSKVAVAPLALAGKSTHLVAICRLSFDDSAEDTQMRQVRGQDALAALLPTVIRFVLDEPSMQEREFDQLSRLARAIPIYEIRRPRRREQIDRVCDRLLSVMDLRGQHRAEGDLVR